MICQWPLSHAVAGRASYYSPKTSWESPFCRPPDVRIGYARMRLRKGSKMPTENSDIFNTDDIEGPQFNMKQFITEVELRPAIWDSTTFFYSDKLLKKRCWDELVDIFFNKENPTKEEKKEYHKILQRKWKSARDCFNRECQRLRMNKQGIATSRKSQYIFYKNLSFLLKVMNKSKSTSGKKKAEPASNDTSNSTDASNISNNDASNISNNNASNNIADVSSDSNSSNESPNYAADTSSSTDQLNPTDIYPIDDNDLAPGCSTMGRSKRNRTEMDLDDDDSGFTRMLQPNIQLIEGKVQTTESAPKTPDDDSDRLFLLSLLEPLKHVPKNLQMSVRVKMMQIVDSAVRYGMDVTQ